jgi:hypothetical protein
LKALEKIALDSMGESKESGAENLVPTTRLTRSLGGRASSATIASCHSNGGE